MTLTIKVKGHGTEIHKEKKAARIKRILEVNLHEQVKVTREVNGRNKTVKRDDSNAFVE